MRTPDRLIAHYELERRLTDRLRNAPHDERSSVYSEVYAELFRALPDHPQTLAKQGARARATAREWTLLARHLTEDSRVLEIGCGDAAFAFTIAPHVRQVYGLDVTDALVGTPAPANFTFIKTGGVDIPLPDASIDVAYSNQLVEHLHPDDVVAQFAEIRRVLVPGGLYRCSTPSRVSGPHDVSCYFDYTATGLHLREYDYASLHALFLKAGFRAVDFYITGGARQFRTPYWAVRAAEACVLSVASQTLRARIANLPFIRQAMGLTAVGHA